MPYLIRFYEYARKRIPLHAGLASMEYPAYEKMNQRRRNPALSPVLPSKRDFRDNTMKPFWDIIAALNLGGGL